MTDNKPRLIVSLTSWRQRIGGVRRAVENIMGGTLLPDRIVLNLSSDEFPLREAELPADLVDMQRDGRFEIWWVGRNTKAFKKLIPTLERYPDDVIITIDDDIEYDADFVERLYGSFVRSGAESPVTSRQRLTLGVHFACGAGSVYMRRFFGDKLSLLDDEIIATNNDDWFYTYALLLNKVLFVASDSVDSKRFAQIYSIAPMSRSAYSGHNTRRVLDALLQRVTGCRRAKYVVCLKRERLGQSRLEMLWLQVSDVCRRLVRHF